MMHIASTLKDRPVRAIVYGSDGVGKSTFAAGAPGAVFVPTELGLSNIDARATDMPSSWKDLVDYVKALASEPSCQTVVVDSLDGAEALCWKHACEIGDDKGPKSTIEDFGFGKGYVLAMHTWRELANACDACLVANKHVILIAHSERKVVKSPHTEDYEALQIRLHVKAAAYLREYVDVVGLAEVAFQVAGDKGAKKATTGGRRVLRTGPNPAFSSKTRYDIPSSVPLDWESFYGAISASRTRGIDSYVEEFNSLVSKLNDTSISDKAIGFINGSTKDRAAYIRSIAAVKSYLVKQETGA